MRLNPHAREYLYWDLTEAPVGATYEVTFDNGTTWNAMEFIGPASVRILVAGPKATEPHPGGTVVLQEGSYEHDVWLRTTSSPQLLIRGDESLVVL